MRFLAALALLAAAAGALPPISLDYVRLREFRERIRLRAVEIQEREAFDAKPREERMLLVFRKREKFEGKEMTAKAVVAACLEWADVKQQAPPEAGERVLALLPVVLRERWTQSFDRKERRHVSVILLKALDSDFPPVRKAADASLRGLYGAPRGESYDPAAPARDRAGPIRAWKRHVAQANR